jgi:hypothetical protein
MSPEGLNISYGFTDYIGLTLSNILERKYVCQKVLLRILNLRFLEISFEISFQSYGIF